MTSVARDPAVPQRKADKPVRAEPHSASLRVLVAEDGLVNRKLAVSVLQREGHEVTLATNGENAVRALRYANFDLVLMDVEMPVMDGLAATNAIRQRESQRGGHLAIVAVTSSSGPDECLAAGMDAYLPKPLRHDALTQTMQQVLGV